MRTIIVIFTERKLSLNEMVPYKRYKFLCNYDTVSLYDMVEDPRYRGTSGAMIAGAMLNELHNINPTTKTYILIVRKEEDTSAHCSSLRGIDEVGTTRFIVVDDFIASGETIEAVIQALDRQLGVSYHPSNKYDMLCVSNFIDAKALKKDSCDDYRKWKGIYSRFEYVVCCPKPE